MVAVHGIAAAGEVIVASVGGEEVVDIVVKALKGEHRAPLVPLRRVVEHHVQIDLDSPLMAGLNKALELVALPVVLGGGGVAGVGGEKAHRAVAPVVEQSLAVHLTEVLHLVKLEDGHQLDGVDPQLLNIVQLLHQAGEGAGVGDPGGEGLGEAPDVEFVDNQVLHGQEGLVIAPPVEVVLDHPGLVVLTARGGLDAPLALAGDCLGVGVQQIAASVEKQALGGVVGALHPVGVLKLVDVQLEDDHRVDIADPVVFGEGNHGVGLVRLPVEEEQRDGLRALGVDGEVDAAGDGGGAVNLIEAGADIEPVHMVHGDQVDGAGQADLNGLLGADGFLHIGSSLF